MWFSLCVNGIAAYRTAIDAGIAMAEEAARLIEAHPAVELVRPPGLSVVLFRRPGWSEGDYTSWSTQLLNEQIGFVTPTRWEGEMVARLAFLHPETDAEIVTEILDTMR